MWLWRHRSVVASVLRIACDVGPVPGADAVERGPRGAVERGFHADQPVHPAAGADDLAERPHVLRLRVRRAVVAAGAGRERVVLIEHLAGLDAGLGAEQVLVVIAPAAAAAAGSHVADA